MSYVQVPIKVVNKEKWADLGALALTHEIVAEKCNKVEENYSFAGGHRVRLWKFKKNVHFKVPSGVDLDISGVAPAVAPTPPRRQGNR